MCSPGFTGPGSVSCVECYAGKYKAVTGSVACTGCPNGAGLPTGSKAADDCILHSSDANLDHTIDARAMLIVFPCKSLTRSMVFLVRVGYSVHNDHDAIQNKGLRGLALARCHQQIAPSITCGPSVDTIGSVQESVDAGSPAGTNAVLSFNPNQS